MDCFIKKIWEGKGEQAHSQFVRFSRGEFENRALLNLQKTSKIKLKGSFEWANDFVEVISELDENIKFSGIILSKQPLDLEGEKKKKAIFQYETEIDSSKVREIKNKTYAMLLDAETEDIKLKIKKKLPKPGKSEKKVDDKFCQLEADLKFWPQIREAFMLPDYKRCKISHTIIVEDIILPDDEKDSAKIRELAREKGKIIRKLEVDKQESREEKNFEA